MISEQNYNPCMRDATSHTEKPVRILECYGQAQKKKKKRFTKLKYKTILNTNQK
jgi:hypothetical protein